MANSFLTNEGAATIIYIITDRLPMAYSSVNCISSTMLYIPQDGKGFSKKFHGYNYILKNSKYAFGKQR